MSSIMIVDDDSQVRLMLRMTFEDAGYLVSDAADGKAALSLFHKDPVDVVITDILMPEMEGLETIIELRRAAPDLKVIAISGGGKVSAAGYLETAIQLGAVRTFKKPVDRDELVSAVDKLT